MFAGGRGASQPAVGPSGGAAIAPPRLKHLPQTAYLCFDAAPPAAGLGKKLREFNGLLAADTQQMTAEQVQAYFQNTCI